MSELFQFLTTDDLRLLAERARHAQYATGETILREGDVVHGIYVLRGGRVKVEKAAGSIPPILITELGTGEVFGEMSFVDGHAASASIIALEAVEVDILGRDDVISLLASVPGLSSRFYQSLAKTLSERLRATTKDLACP